MQQARVDRGEQVIVGVNKYQLAEEPDVDVLDIDNSAVRDSQIARLQKVRAERDTDACRAGPRRTHEAAKTGRAICLSWLWMPLEPALPSARLVMLWSRSGAATAPRHDQLVVFMVLPIKAMRAL